MNGIYLLIRDVVKNFFTFCGKILFRLLNIVIFSLIFYRKFQQLGDLNLCINSVGILSVFFRLIENLIERMDKIVDCTPKFYYQ